MIAGIAQALGAERINIADFDLQHLSSERGGTLAILVAGEGEAERAAALLEQPGLRRRRRAGPRGRVVKIEPAAAISGHIAVPGDKSLSHRAVLLAAVGEGETRISGFGRSEDTEATIKAVRDLGVRVYEADPETLRVFGAGLRGLKAPKQPLDCGNAGTLMRLLPGLLAGQEGRFELTGDESLRSRPMERIAEPLRQMAVDRRDDGRPSAVHGRGRRADADHLRAARSRARR